MRTRGSHMRQDAGDGIGGAAMEKRMAAVERKPRSRIDAEQNKNKKRNPTPYPTAQIV